MEYKRLYIAYGSNINLEQMANRCPNSKVVGKEMLKGYELEFRGVATIVPQGKRFCVQPPESVGMVCRGKAGQGRQGYEVL